MNTAVLILFISLVLFPLHLFASMPLDDDQWSPINDVKDPHITKIGEFAVSEYVRLNTSLRLKFMTVVSGSIQIISNVKYYKLVVAVNDGGDSESKNYETVVWNLKSISELMDFRPLF
ncbi:hypothetical protein N665_0529s0003 [Sinapis alba]|nr:hypothetical protein N665_0529s0003 [Sinapis alba]